MTGKKKMTRNSVRPGNFILSRIATNNEKTRMIGIIISDCFKNGISSSYSKLPLATRISR
ncbi:hypothetical protein D3C84_1152240 [compost metagenome]